MTALEAASGQISRGILGQTEADIALFGKEDFRTAAVCLARQARRKIQIFSHDLELEQYDNPDFYEAIKQLAIRVRDPSIFILLQDSERVQREGNRLVELASRLPSKIRIFRPLLEPHRHHTENFMVVDEMGFVYRKLYTRLEGRLEFRNPGRARELAGFFQDVWNDSEEESALRRL
jgi:hypothetical protein